MTRLAILLLSLVLIATCGFADTGRDYTTNEVTVTILGADGAPVPGAKVRAWSETWGSFAPWDRYKTIDTDANGQVKFKMTVGEWSVFASADNLYLADVHHKVTPDTKEITVRPDSTLTLEAKDLDGLPLEDAEVHIYTVEHRPVVPMMVAGTMTGGKAEIPTIGHQMYGVMLVTRPTDTAVGLVLHWDHVRDKYAFEPNKDWLRKLTIHARDLDGGPGEIETRISFPELTCVWDFRNNPGEFTIPVKDTAVLLMEPSYVEVETILRKDGWLCRYFPSFFDLLKLPSAEVTYGDQHTIVPKVYARENYLSATWLCMEDAYGHISFEVKNPDNKLPPLEFNFRDKDGNRLYGDVEAGQWAPAVRFTKDLICQDKSPDKYYEVASFDGVIDYGPFGKRVFKGDPRADEFAFKVECIGRGPHFELMTTTDPQVKPQIDVMLNWMEYLYKEYDVYWGLGTYLADKPVTIYFEPNLSNAIGGLSYGNKMINAWMTDLLDFTDPWRNALCHMQNIVCHEYFHTCQAIPEMKWGGRSLYPSTYIGESFPQVGMNRVYQRFYGPVVAKMHQGMYLDGFLKRLAGENVGGNKEAIWEEIAYDNGDEALRRGLELLGDRDWKQWDWMIRSGYDVPVALMALYECVTGKDYAYMARLTGDAEVTDDAVEQAYALVQSGKSPFPEVCEGAFITKWLVLGPFDDKGVKFVTTEQTPNEGDLHPKAGDELLGKNWIAFESTEADGHVDMGKAVAEGEKIAGFVYATVNASRASKGYLWIGSDDGAKVYLNGKEVFLKDIPQGAVADNYIAPVELRAGENTILIKINNQGGGPWGFYVRFSDLDGKAIATQ
jgi:hypothetical protein